MTDTKEAIVTEPRTLEKLAYKPVEAAEALGISRARLFELLRDGSLQSVNYGRTRLISRASIDEFLKPPEA